VTWRDIVPLNTDHIQVRLGLVLFLVTWRNILPHNTDHFQVRLPFVLFLVIWRDILPHYTDHSQIRLGLVLFLVTCHYYFPSRCSHYSVPPLRVSAQQPSATASCPWRHSPSSDVHGYNAVAGGCCAGGHLGPIIAQSIQFFNNICFTGLHLLRPLSQTYNDWWKWVRVKWTVNLRLEDVGNSLFYGLLRWQPSWSHTNAVDPTKAQVFVV